MLCLLEKENKSRERKSIVKCYHCIKCTKRRTTFVCDCSIIIFCSFTTLLVRTKINRRKLHFLIQKQKKVLFVSHFIGHTPFTLIATTSVQYGVKIGTMTFFYFCMRKILFHQYSANCCMFDWVSLS